MKKYCSYCGARLIKRKVSVDKIVHCYYDCYKPYIGQYYSPKTGKKLYAIEWRCPNYRWWQFGGTHTKYVEEEPYEEIPPRDARNSEEP